MPSVYEDEIELELKKRGAEIKAVDGDGDRRLFVAARQRSSSGGCGMCSMWQQQ